MQGASWVFFREAVQQLSKIHSALSIIMPCHTVAGQSCLMALAVRSALLEVMIVSVPIYAMVDYIH